MLKLRPFLTANALVGLAFGVVLVAAPGALLRLFAIPEGIGTGVCARLLGATLLGLNVPTWLARENEEGAGAAFAVLGHALSETLGFAVSLGAAIAGVGNALVWLVVALYAFFAAGNLWFIVRKGVRVA